MLNRGFVISGGSSSVGKTTVTLGLMNLFTNIAPFKVGPDFIDPSYHKIITKEHSYNLDIFLMGKEGVKYSFFTHMKEINIVEGVMGLYDGINNSLDNYSTAHLAKTLNLPVILVVNGKGRSLSLASEILGYKNFDKDINIIGVILNRINSNQRYLDLKDGIEKHTGIKCIGYLPEREEFSLDSRHLGLLQAHEIKDLQSKIDLASEELSKSLDMEFILNNTVLKYSNDEIEEAKNLFSPQKDKYKGIKIGVAKDDAFTFYYEDNLELFKKMGMEIKYFSPVNDETIPSVDMLYFGGGYPENYLEKLSSNKTMIKSIHDFYESNKVVFGECGGFIYLSKGIYDSNNEFYSLCGIADCQMKMFDKLDIKRFGYANVELKNRYLGKAHEFHYSQIVETGEMKKEYNVTKESGKKWVCGYSDKNFLAGYPHFHFFQSLDILDEILKGVYQEKKGENNV